MRSIYKKYYVSEGVENFKIVILSINDILRSINHIV